MIDEDKVTLSFAVYSIDDSSTSLQGAVGLWAPLGIRPGNHVLGRAKASRHNPSQVTWMQDEWLVSACASPSLIQPLSINFFLGQENAGSRSTWLGQLTKSWPCRNLCDNILATTNACQTEHAVRVIALLSSFEQPRSIAFLYIVMAAQPCPGRAGIRLCSSAHKRGESHSIVEGDDQR